MKDKVLYLFTASFPFSSGETFLETEIKFLSEAFKKIYILPLFAYQTKNARNVPINCKVFNPIIRNRWQHYFIGLFGLKSLQVYIPEFFKNGIIKRRNWFKDFIGDFCTTNNILQSITLLKILRKINENDLMYFYWGKGLANILPFITKIKAKKIVRFHGGDLYDVNYGGYIPIQKQIIQNTDISVFISKHGKNYLCTRYLDLVKKPTVSYLGSEDFGVSGRSDDGVFRLLSCSNVIPIKRVHLIYYAIQNITDYPILWTHIGDGTKFNELQEKVNNTRENVKINLLGRLPYKDVFNFYLNNFVDAFINVSSTEGLPMSIIEAISFNVPVIATDVGGTSEIVTSETGILLSENPGIDDIVHSIEKLRVSNLEPRLFWEKNFSAERNYERFANILLSCQH